jgi:hypothetical protein
VGGSNPFVRRNSWAIFVTHYSEPLHLPAKWTLGKLGITRRTP